MIGWRDGVDACMEGWTVGGWVGGWVERGWMVGSVLEPLIDVVLLASRAGGQVEALAS